MERKTIRKSRRAILLVLLPLLLVVSAGCGSQAAMGWSSPTVDEGVLYAGMKTGRLYALDTDNGDELWAFPADSLLAGIYSSPVLREQVVFFGSYEIELSSFLIFQSQDIQGRAYAVDGVIVQGPDQRALVVQDRDYENEVQDDQHCQ